MTEYSDWKIFKSDINEKADEYTEVAAWCNNNGYKIIETDSYYEVQKVIPYIPTNEDIKRARADYRRSHIDDQTAERSRKQANGTWTDADENVYLALDAEVTAWIENNLPYTE